jgi:hypothetical protein
MTLVPSLQELVTLTFTHTTLTIKPDNQGWIMDIKLLDDSNAYVSFDFTTRYNGNNTICLFGVMLGLYDKDGNLISSVDPSTLVIQDEFSFTFFEYQRFPTPLYRMFHTYYREIQNFVALNSFVKKNLKNNTSSNGQLSIK